MAQLHFDNFYYELLPLSADTAGSAVSVSTVGFTGQQSIGANDFAYGIIRYEETAQITPTNPPIAEERVRLLTEFKIVKMNGIDSGGAVSIDRNDLSDLVIGAGTNADSLKIRLVIYSAILSRDTGINRGIIDKSLIPNREDNSYEIGSMRNRVAKIHVNDVAIKNQRLIGGNNEDKFIAIPNRDGTMALTEDMGLLSFVRPPASVAQTAASKIMGGEQGELAVIQQVGIVATDTENGSDTVIYTPLAAVLTEIFGTAEIGTHETITVNHDDENGVAQTPRTFDSVIIEGQDGGYVVRIAAEPNIELEYWEAVLQGNAVAVPVGYRAFYARSAFYDRLVSESVHTDAIQAKTITADSVSAMDYNNFLFTTNPPTTADLEGKGEGFNWRTKDNLWIKHGESWLDTRGIIEIFPETTIQLDSSLTGRVFNLETNSVTDERYKWADFASTSLFGEESNNEMTVQVAHTTSRERRHEGGRWWSWTYFVTTTQTATITVRKEGDRSTSNSFRVVSYNADGISEGTIPAVTGSV